MKIIAKPCGGGKTTEMIDMALENNYAIIVATKKDCERVKNLARYHNKGCPLVFTISQMIKPGFDSVLAVHGRTGIIIDDIEDSLNILFNLKTPIVAFSITTKREPEENK